MELDNCLPEDVLLEIFFRLPQKARLRCEAVSKEWWNLIGKTANSFSARALDSCFVGFDYKKVSLYRLDDKGAFHVQDEYSLVSRLSAPSSSNGDYIWDIGSCNGFIFFLKKDGLPIKKQNYHIYNPVTRHLTTLPDPPPLSTEEEYPLGVGFAPDLETNHYKFLVFFYLPCPREWDTSKGSLSFVGAIFNSETREWKTKRPISFPFNLDCRHSNLLGPSALYCRGSLYWLLEYSSCLPVFSIKTETFRFLSLPKVVGRYCGVLWESEGSSIHFCDFCEIQGLCIWVLEENLQASIGGTCSNHTWRKIYCLSKTRSNSLFAQAIRPVPYSFSFISGVLGFNEHLQIVLLETSGCHVWYDISAKRMSPVPPCDDLPSYGTRYLSFTYNNNMQELQDINEPAYKPIYSATAGTSRKRRHASDQLSNLSTMRITRSRSREGLG